MRLLPDSLAHSSSATTLDGGHGLRESLSMSVLSIHLATRPLFVAIAIFGALIADRTHFIAGLQTSLTIAAVMLLATVAISVRIRPTDHQRRLSSN